MRLLRPVVVLPASLALLVVAGCGSSTSSAPRTSATATSTSASTAPTSTAPPQTALPELHGSPADLATVRAAGDAVALAGTASYVYEETAKAPGENSTPLTTRTGSLDFRHKTGEVKLDVLDEDGGGTDSATFLLAPKRVLLDLPSFTQKTGKRWTLLPLDQVTALAHGTALVPALPGADVLRAADAALPTAKYADSTSYSVYVKEYDALALLSNTATQQLQQKTGKAVADLQQEFNAVVQLDIDLDAKGRLSVLNADLTGLVEHYGRRIDEAADDDVQVTLRETVSDLGLPVTIDQPAASDIGTAPSD